MNLVSKHALVLGVGAVTAAAALAGCAESKESGTESTTASTSVTTSAQPGTAASATSGNPAPAPGAGQVKLNGADLGPVTGVNCQTTDGEITIAIESTPKTVLVLTDAASPGVTSVSIGQLGAEGPSAAYVAGVSESPPQVTRDGNSYTVTGTGNGTDPADPSKPVDLPFEIAVTCP